MTKPEGTVRSLQGGGFIRGSALGLGQMFLGWRSLFLGACGTLAGFGGAITNEGAATRATLVAIGCASLALVVVTRKYMKNHRDRDNDA
ncbi:hypothetical protein ACWD7Y_20195 [Streptomyces drozdowiczii]